MNQNPAPLPGKAAGDLESPVLQQVTLIGRLLEDEAGVIIHDYTVNGGTATLSCSLPLSAAEAARRSASLLAEADPSWT